MEKKRRIKSVEDFVTEANRCKSGRYEFGVDEDTAERSGSLIAIIEFNGARIDYNCGEKDLILYSQVSNMETDKVRITNVSGVEQKRDNPRIDVYVITAGLTSSDRHLLFLDKKL